MHNIEYRFKKESFTLKYNNQYICYHAYNDPKKSNFRTFKKYIQREQPQDIIHVISLATKNKIASQAGNKIIF